MVAAYMCARTIVVVVTKRTLAQWGNIRNTPVAWKNAKSPENAYSLQHIYIYLLVTRSDKTHHRTLWQKHPWHSRWWWNCDSNLEKRMYCASVRWWVCQIESHIWYDRKQEGKENFCLTKLGAELLVFFWLRLWAESWEPVEKNWESELESDFWLWSEAGSRFWKIQRARARAALTFGPAPDPCPKRFDA